jgi:hypothetical protein
MDVICTPFLQHPVAGKSAAPNSSAACSAVLFQFIFEAGAGIRSGGGGIGNKQPLSYEDQMWGDWRVL